MHLNSHCLIPEKLMPQSFLNSVMGATWQASVPCATCQRVSERFRNAAYSNPRRGVLILIPKRPERNLGLGILLIYYWLKGSGSAGEVQISPHHVAEIADASLKPSEPLREHMGINLCRNCMYPKLSDWTGWDRLTESHTCGRTERRQ